MRPSEDNQAAAPDSGNRSFPHSPDECEPLSREIALREAARLVERLSESAIRNEEGTVWWAGFACAESGGCQPYRVGYELYNGICGIALFIAAFERVTGDARFHGLALEALRSFKTLPKASGGGSQSPSPDLPIGGVVGIGSIIYSLTRISLLLDEPEFVDEARKITARLTPESVCTGVGFDITNGAAGALLGFLAYHETSGDAHALELARACGLYLSGENANDTLRQGEAHTSPGGLLPTGFSHGAAGVAYALLRLHGATGDSRFLNEAERAIACERNVFDAAVNNWPSLRSDGGHSYLVAWCHGAPGIGLGRLGGLGILDTPEIHADIAASLDTTLRLGLRPRDHLCCGSLGTAEVLLEAGLVLGCPDLVEAARKRAAFVLESARRRGSYNLPEPGGVENPGFFIGIAGIGYEYLRLVFPRRLPCVLRFE